MRFLFVLREFRVQFRLSLSKMPYASGVKPRAVMYRSYVYSEPSDQALIVKIFNWRLDWVYVEDIYLEIRKSQIDGMGLFSVNGVGPYSVLGKYTGEICSKESRESCKYACDFSEHRLLSARDIGNEFRYINHDQTGANVCFIKICNDVYVVTKQQISENSELLVDYGSRYWTT